MRSVRALVLLLSLVLSAVLGLAPATADRKVPAVQNQTCWSRLNNSPTDYPTVQAAVDASTQPTDVVKVAGYCAGVEQRAGLTQTVYLSKTLTLQGGYTTTNWVTPDPVAHPTTLDALGNGRALLIAGDIQPTVAGLRLTGGDAARAGADPYGQHKGGGIYVYTATATISGCTIYSNTADSGGGLYTYASALKVYGSTFTSNTATFIGGGMLMYEGAGRLAGNAFISNTAGTGAGAYFGSEAVTLTNNSFLSNTALYDGAGVIVEIYGGHSELVGNTVAGNHAYWNGGGLYFGEGVRVRWGGTGVPPVSPASSGFSPAVLQAVFCGGLRPPHPLLQGACGPPQAPPAPNLARNLAGVQEHSPATRSSKWPYAGESEGAAGPLSEGIRGQSPPEKKPCCLLFAGNLITHNWARNAGGGVFMSGDGGAADFVGNTVQYNAAGGDGGGIYLDWSAEPTPILSNTVTGNVAGGNGGGIYLGTTTATVRGNMVQDNQAGGNGGGVYGRGTLSGNQLGGNIASNGGGACGSGRLEGNAVISNSAYMGGGLYLDGNGGSSVLTANVILSNTAFMSGGGIWAVSGTVVLTGNTVTANHADAYYGGGLYLNSSTAVLTDNVVLLNTAREGGGLNLSSGTVTLTANIVASNEASCCGGGLYLYETIAALRANVIGANHVDVSGGGLFLTHNSDAQLVNNWVVENNAAQSGSGLLVWGSHARMMHTTVVGDGGQSGTGIVVSGNGPYVGVAALTNTILVNHTVGISVALGYTATLEATLWGNDTDWAGGGNIYTGTVNVWGDPAFLDPAGGDYHIGAGSAALDAGVYAGISTDIDGDPRPIGAGYDIGADEATFATWQIYLPLVGK